MSLVYVVDEPVSENADDDRRAYTVYEDGVPLAFINTDLPRDKQEEVARLFLAAHLLLQQPAR